MNPGLRCLPGVLAMFVIACSQTTAPQPAAEAEASTPAAAVPAASGSAPVTAEASTPALANAPVYDARVIHFGGYGPAAFLGNEESVRQAFGRPMAARPELEEPGACYYLQPEAQEAKGFGIAFMFEGDKFVRYDVRDAGIVAPGGLVVGMPADAVSAAFPGQVEIQPNKYEDDAKVLIVTPKAGGDARLIFETDSAGTISRWRIGVEPQVHYVEGCS